MLWTFLTARLSRSTTTNAIIIAQGTWIGKSARMASSTESFSIKITGWYAGTSMDLAKSAKSSRISWKICNRHWSCLVSSRSKKSLESISSKMYFYCNIGFHQGRCSGGNLPQAEIRGEICWKKHKGGKFDTTKAFGRSKRQEYRRQEEIQAKRRRKRLGECDQHWLMKMIVISYVSLFLQHLSDPILWKIFEERLKFDLLVAFLHFPKSMLPGHEFVLEVDLLLILWQEYFNVADVVSTGHLQILLLVLDWKTLVFRL